MNLGRESVEPTPIIERSARPFVWAIGHTRTRSEQTQVYGQVCMARGNRCH